METAVVRLNVGGTLFTTSRSTLTKIDSFFTGLLHAHDTSSDGSIFVDRDPTHFRHVLNYLRGAPSYPGTRAEIDELSAEADFYCLPGFSDELAQRRTNARQDEVSYQLSVIATRLQH